MRHKLTQEKFLEKAKIIHNNKYDYSKVNYINSQTKIIIICKEHGDFIQTPTDHLNGHGCPKCKADKIGDLKRLSLNEFIEKAKAIHGNKYDYSKVIYINSWTKVCIICSDHGEFYQFPTDHIRGSNCPYCQISKGELVIKEILDKYKVKYEQEYRIPKINERLYYDFYLPELNTLIEFHGIQHYKYIPFMHNKNEDNFLKQKIRDDVARSNARSFKYRYLEFNYKQLKELSKEQFEQLIINKILVRKASCLS